MRIRLIVTDTRIDPFHLGKATMAGTLGRERLALDRPAAEVVEQAISKVLTDAGYGLSRDSELIYRINISEFTASFSGGFLQEAHAVSELTLDVAIERGGSIVSRKEMTGYADIAVPFLQVGSPLQFVICWISCVPDWHLFGVPGVEEATAKAFNDALDRIITDQDLALALDPYSVQRPVVARPEKKASPYRRRLAVVIGISDYWLWPRRENSLADARRVASTLRDAGFDEVIELHDARATRQSILALLGTELQSKTAPNDLVLIYFAGHGATESLSGGQTRGYIIPVDADTQWIFSTAITLAKLFDLGNRLPVRHIYFAMASCFSGVDFAQPLATPADPATYDARIHSTRSVQMIMAGRDGEEALVENGEGIFTSFWIRALLGEADGNHDGYATGSEIGDYVALRVGLASGNRQSPQSGRIEGAGQPLFPVR
jgi:hypothetical protein